MSTQVAVIEQVRAQLEKMEPQFRAALPKHVDPARFVRVTMTALQMNPNLLQADRRTLFASAMRASQMGLLPDGREGAIVMFKDQAQFMPMVAGIMKLVRNSGEISTWSVQAVHENDEFECVFGDDERITHKRSKGPRGPLIGAYSIVLMKDGERSREYMDLEEITAVRKRSRSGTSGPWVTDFAEMAKKTVVRRHSKRLPMSTDLDEVLREDDALFHAPEQEAPPAADSEAPKRTRASRLDKVAEQAPPSSDIIDMPPNGQEYPIDGDDSQGGTPPAGDHDSPI